MPGTGCMAALDTERWLADQHTNGQRCLEGRAIVRTEYTHYAPPFERTWPVESTSQRNCEKSVGASEALGPSLIRERMARLLQENNQTSERR